MKRRPNWFETALRFARNPLTVGVGFLTLSKYLAMIIGFVTTATAARVLGPNEYGIATLLMGFPLLVWSFASLKSLSVTTRYMARFRSNGQVEELSSISRLGFGLDMVTGIGAASVIAISSQFIVENLIHIPAFAWLSVVFGFSFPFYSLVGTSQAILSACERLPWLAFIQLFDRSITFLFVITALQLDFGVEGMVLASALAHVVAGLASACVATITLHREGVHSWWRASLGPIGVIKGELFRFFGWSYLTASLTGLVGQGPALMLGHWEGPRAAGFYRLAMSIFNVSSYMANSLWAVVYPRLSIRWAAGERQEIKDSLWRWSRRFGLPIAVVLLGGATLLPFVLPIALGGAYSAMVAGVQLLLFGAAVKGLFFYLNPFFYASGRFDQWGKAYALYAAVVVGLSPLMIDASGFTGVAGLVGLGFAAFNFGMVVLLRLQLNANPRGQAHAESEDTYLP